MPHIIARFAIVSRHGHTFLHKSPGGKYLLILVLHGEECNLGWGGVGWGGVGWGGVGWSDVGFGGVMWGGEGKWW